MKRLLFKAWFIRTFHKDLVKLNLEEGVKVALFDVIMMASEDSGREFLYVGKDLYKPQKSFIKKGEYPKLRVSGNFKLHEFLL